jgi:tetratricopeptide (TPR) repeat protein
LKRIPLLAALSFLTIAGRARAGESLKLDANENLFCVLAALNAAGYDDGLALPDNSPLRKQFRAYIEQQNPPVLAELRRFYGKHSGVSAYISWALSVTGPPDFAWRTRDVDVPPDARSLEGFAPLMIDFYRQARMDQLWDRARPVYEQELEKYHSPILEMTTRVDGYMRVGTGAYLGRRFSVFVDLLAAPEQVQTRNYGDDAFVIVTPAEHPRLYDIRHAYLHFQIDPIMIKYGMDLQQKRSLLDLVQLAPLEENYKNDFVLLANESLIKAVESRLDRNPAAIDQAMRQGYVLTAYFGEQLPAFEQQQQGLRYFTEDMIANIDLKRESARISAVRFDSGPLQRKAKQVAVAGPELSPSAKTLEQAEALYSDRSFEKARELFTKALEQRGSDEEHAQAWYGLARVALQQKQPETAVKLFEKTLSGSPDAFTKGWSLVYLARLANAADEPEKAVKFYRDAMAVAGASDRALEAARKESQNIRNQEISK